MTNESNDSSVAQGERKCGKEKQKGEEVKGNNVDDSKKGNILGSEKQSS